MSNKIKNRSRKTSRRRLNFGELKVIEDIKNKHLMNESKSHVYLGSKENGQAEQECCRSSIHLGILSIIIDIQILMFNVLGIILIEGMSKTPTLRHGFLSNIIN